MNKVLLIMLVGILSISVKAQTKEEIKKDFTGPVFEFEQETIDYGDILKNSDGLRVFKFENTGAAPILIQKVKSSCGCTVPTFSKEPIMPGKTGEIQVKYATNRVGPFSKNITISSNAFETSKMLRIKGRVLDKEADNPLEKKKSVVSEK